MYVLTLISTGCGQGQEYNKVGAYGMGKRLPPIKTPLNSY